MPNKVVNITIEMEREWADIFFWVVDKVDKTPIAGAEVEVLDMNGESVNVFITDVDGKAIFTDMPTGKMWNCSCRVKGYKEYLQTVQT